MRSKVAKKIVKTLPTENGPGNIAAAFLKNTFPMRSIFAVNPAGWGRRSRKTIERVRNEADTFVKSLNDKFADPLGRKEAEEQAKAEAEAKKEA